MAKRAGLLRNRLNERTLRSWGQTNESLPAADSSSPVIAVMQPAHAPLANHCTVFQRACPASRRLLVQPEVRSVVVIIGNVLGEESLQMPLIQGDHVVEQVAAAAPNARRPHFARDSELRYGPVSCSASASTLALPSHTSRHGRVGEIWARNRREKLLATAARSRRWWDGE
jgi:hypothetical protein